MSMASTVLVFTPAMSRAVLSGPPGAELLFEVFSLRYERGSTIVTSNLPFQDWPSVLGSGRLPPVLLERLTHHVHILSMNDGS